MHVVWFLLIAALFIVPFIVGIIIAMSDNLTLKLILIGLFVLVGIGIYVMSVVERVNEKEEQFLFENKITLPKEIREKRYKV